MWFVCTFTVCSFTRMSVADLIFPEQFSYVKIFFYLIYSCVEHGIELQRFRSMDVISTLVIFSASRISADKKYMTKN